MKNLSIIFILFCILINSSSLAQSKCQMLFSDEFNYNRPFSQKGKSVSNSIEDGYYYIEVLKKRRAVKVTYKMDIDESKKFEIETSITKISTSKTNGYGICFGFSDVKNYFCFIVNHRGEFKFFKKRNGKETEIIPWTESEYINIGVGSTNRLMIIKEGDELKFYSNGNLLAVNPFQSFFGNMVGFKIHGKQKVAIDYIRVTYSLNEQQN